MRRRLFAAVAALATAALFACTSLPSPPARPIAYPAVRFAVLSDPHVYDPGLGVEGAAFRSISRWSRLLWSESASILGAAVDALVAYPPDFVVVCGDLTKDGEESSHLLAAEILGRLRTAGIPVFVLPGNHDIRNPRAEACRGDSFEPVPSLAEAGFERIWGDMGFLQAYDRDGASLSYAARVVPGLTIVCLDPYSYAGVSPERPEPRASFSDATLRWLSRTIAEAEATGSAVLVACHHNVLEHFRGQAGYLPDSLVEDRDRVARLLAASGVRLLLTGHLHAMDVVAKDFPSGARLYEATTPSLAGHPAGYREFVSDGGARLRASFVSVADIPSAPAGLRERARAVSREGARFATEWRLLKAGASRADSRRLASAVADAYIGFAEGDEDGPADIGAGAFGPAGWIASLAARPLVEAMGVDLPPEDVAPVLELGP